MWSGISRATCCIYAPEKVEKFRYVSDKTWLGGRNNRNLHLQHFFNRMPVLMKISPSGQDSGYNPDKKKKISNRDGESHFLSRWCSVLLSAWGAKLLLWERCFFPQQIVPCKAVASVDISFFAGEVVKINKPFLRLLSGASACSRFSICLTGRRQKH